MGQALSDSVLDQLDPTIADAAGYLIGYVRALGVPLVITSALRTPEEQAVLIANGETYARHSKHLDGMAVDLAVLGFPSRDPANAWLYSAIGQMGESLGLRWGGRFSSPDVVHFDI